MALAAKSSVRLRGSPAGPLIVAALLSSLTACSSNARLHPPLPAPPVTVTPERAAVVAHQAVVLNASAGDGNFVNWSASGNCSGSGCGVFSSSSSPDAISVTWTAPSGPGVYTITATSSADSSKTASTTVGVTDLAGVTTYHNDLARDGANTQEYALTPSTVASPAFGKLFSCAVDGAIYTQPLWIPNLSLASVTRNVVFVATQHDSLYAFDADSAANSCQPLWKVSLIDAAHGASSGETTVPSDGPNRIVGQGFGDIAPEVGVTGTPVIDLTTDTLYVVSKSVIPGSRRFFQRLHAIDVRNGDEKLAGPVTIAATFLGGGDGGSTTTFLPGQQNQRAALALVNGVIYIAWASHEDNPPYYGWVLGYDAQTLAQVSTFNDTPDTGWGGIWMGGAAPAADSSGNLYLITGNATFDAANPSPPNRDYGDSLLKLNGNLTVAQYFTPSDEASDVANDADFGSGGTAILLDLPARGSNPTHLIIGGGKDGALYLLNRDKLGGTGDANARQRLSLSYSIYSTGAFWNSTYYIAGRDGPLSAFNLNTATAKMNLTPSSVSTSTFGFPGSTPSVSASGSRNGILWALDNGPYCTRFSNGCGPTVLHAYDATNLAKELWNSSQNPRDAAGNAVKFTVPTIANGRVYIGTRGNNTGGDNTSTGTPGELDVYGLSPN